MPKILTGEQVDAYHRDGVAFPIRVMSPDEADECQRRFEALEAAIDGEAQARYRIKGHIPFPWLSELIRNAAMLDAVEDLIGPDIVVWGSSTHMHISVACRIACPAPSAGGDALAMQSIGERSRRPEGAGQATRRAAFRGPRPRCPALVVRQHHGAPGA